MPSSSRARSARSRRAPSARAHRGRGIGIVLGAIVAAVAVAAVWPQALGLQRTLGPAHAVSFRVLVAAAAAFAGLAFAAFAAQGPAARRIFAPAAVVLLVAAAGGAGVVANRGWSNEPDPSASASAGEIRVLSWNTRGNEPGSPTIASLALDYGANVVVLPETTRDMGIEVAGLMREGGSPMYVHSAETAPGYRASATTLLISPQLGEYSVDESVGSTTVLASVVAEPVDGDGPRIVAAHPVAPVIDELSNWRSDLDWLSGVCEGDTIAAGDFNATVDHFAGLGRDGGTIGECRDAAVETGSAAVGTWTSGAPPILVPAIDHVAATRGWHVERFAVIRSEDRAGSDHRPVFAALRRADG